MTMAALSGSRYIEYLLRPMRDSADVTQSDLGTEEDLEMLLNTVLWLRSVLVRLGRLTDLFSI